MAELQQNLSEKPPDGKPVIINGLPPKHDRTALLPFSSPVRKKGLPLLKDSMECLAADLSMDISDITLEIEKINKGRDGPEQGMKDTSRLLKEIDTQMEISFEVMEERQNMFREFLKEREKAENKHRRRANQMMSQFTDKISDMEDSLGLNKVSTIISKTSMTQTDLIETNNAQLQTSYAEISEKTNDKEDLQEVVKAFTQDMKEVLQKQLQKEKKLMLHQLEVRNNEIDKQEIEKTITQLNDRLQFEKSQNLRITAEDSLGNNNLFDSPVEDGTNNDVVSDKKQKRTPQAERTFEQLNTLKSACRSIDLLEASLDLVLKEIQTNLELNDEEITYVTSTILPAEKEKRNQLVENMLTKSLATEKLAKQEIQNVFENAFQKHDQVTIAEDNLNNMLTQQIVDSNVGLLKQQFVKVTEKNRQLIQEKEELLETFTAGDENACIINPKTRFYVEPVYIDNQFEERREEFLTIQPKIGGNLFQNLLKFGSKARTQAIDLVHYQQIPLEDVLKDYEIEIEDLYENFNGSKAYQEIDDIIIQNYDNDVTSALKKEQLKTEEVLSGNVPEMEAVKNKLKLLKLEKDKLTATENALLEKKQFLVTNLKNLNRQVADHLLCEEREKEKSDVESRIVQVDEEIHRVQAKMTDIEVLEPAKKRALLSDKLLQLQEDLKKLTPYVNKNSSKYRSSDLLDELPNTEQILNIVDNRVELSRKLIETENKIQDIITSDGYESSESFDTSGEIHNDISVAKEKVKDETCSLNDQLFEIEMELDGVNNQMKDENLRLEDLNNLKASSEKLKKALSDVEEQLKTKSNPVKNGNKEIENLKKEIFELKNRLKQKGSTFEYDESKLGNLLNSKIKYDEKIEQIIERISEDETTWTVLQQSIKCMIEERDRTKATIMSLNEDLRELNELKSNMNGCKTIHDRLFQVDQEILDKKEEGISNMTFIAHEKLESITSKVKHEIEEQIQGDTSKWKVKGNLTNEEKLKLSNELKDIVGDILKTKEEIQCIEKYKSTGDVSSNDHPLMKTLSDKKNDLLSNLDAIQELVVFTTDETKLNQLSEKENEIKQQLNDLDDRVHEQGHVLKERLTKLLGVKQALEAKLEDNISIEDFKTIISVFEEKTDISDDEDVNMLLNDRKILQEDIIQAIQNNDRLVFNKCLNSLENTDAKIFARINKIMTTQQNLDIGTNLPYHVILNPAYMIELRDAKNELEIASKNSHVGGIVNEDNLKHVFSELHKMEELRKIMTDYKARDIELNNYDDIKELKQLNEKKLNHLHKNIRQMNLFIDKAMKLGHVDHRTNETKDREFERITSDVKKINKELGATVTSYTNEIKANEDLLTSKQYVHEIPLKPTSLDFYLQKRDEKLNRLFLVNKLIESDFTGESKANELQNEKESLERKIENIDEKILEGDFDDDDEVGSQTRSFSPRSTSSRNSVTVVLDERDQLMEKIFQLQRKEDFLRESEDILNKHTVIEEIQERKCKLSQRLKEIDYKLHQGGETDETLVEENDSKNTTLHVINEEELQQSLSTLRDELDAGHIKINSNVPIVTDIKELLTHSKETEVLDAIHEINEEINEETLKLKLTSLQSELTKIEDVPLHDNNDLVQSLQEKQGALGNIKAKIYLIEKKEELENEVSNLKEKIQNNDNETDKIEDLTHKQFVKNEQVITKKELKKSKVKLEQELDEMNITVNQYSNSIEKQIKTIELLQKDEHAENDVDREESLQALKSHKNDLERLVLKLQDSKTNETSDAELVELLNERRRTTKEIIETKEKYENENIMQKKDILTKDLRLYYEEDKKNYHLTKEMENKLKILKVKSKTFKQMELLIKPKEDTGRLKAFLGEKLFDTLLDTEKKPPVEKHLQDLILCLEDRTVSEYIKEISTLCTIQTEQIDNLKLDVKKQPDNLSEQITQLENELIAVHQKAEEAENMRRRVQEKLGEELYQLIIGAEQYQDQNNDNFLNAIREFLNQEKGTIENLLRKNNLDSQKNGVNTHLITQLTKDNDVQQKRLADRDELQRIKEILINQLMDDNKDLQLQLTDREDQLAEREDQLADREDQLEMLRQREDDFHSETESLRDNLQQCAHKTSSINEQAVKLKDDYEITKEKLVDTTTHNNHLQNIIKSNENNLLILREELKRMKDESQTSNLEKDKVNSNAKETQLELETIRKKLKRISKEKTTFESNYNTQIDKISNLEGEVNSLKQRETFSKHEMHKHCQIIEKQEKENKKMKDMTSSFEKQNADLQNTINELKEKYQTFSAKHQIEVAKVSKELRTSKSKIEEHRNELEKVYNDIDTSKTEDMSRMKRAYEFEKELHLKDINDLNNQLDEQTKGYEKDIDELTKKQSRLQNELDELTSENKALIQKLQDLDDSFETELSETRKEMSEKYCKSIDQLNEKIRCLANDLIQLEKSKDDVDSNNVSLINENDNLRRQIKEQEMITEEKEKTHQVKEKTKAAELEALTLENNDLQEELIEVRSQSKKLNNIKRHERELKEGKEKLTIAVEQLNSERSQFEESIQFYFKKSTNEEKCASKNLDDRVSIKLLKTSQEERDKISNELINANRELLHTRNELRKLKSLLRQKEEEFLCEEKEMFITYEEKQKHKIDELQKYHMKEKEAFMKMYSEERNKWEEEMQLLKHDLQEDNLKKLSEQRLDFEKDLQQQIDKYLKQSTQEIDELQDQVDVLNSQRVELIKQFETDKITMKKKHESERYALEETIRRLLCNLMKFKAKRNKLKHSHQDEISELEERFDSERERLEGRREQELEILKANLQKSLKNDIQNEKQILHNTFEEIINESTSNKYGPIRTKPEKECDAREGSSSDKFTLNDLKELVHMGDLKDILESGYQVEQDLIKQSMRDQYKVKLRIETDALMRRLLELSEELDSLRGHS